MRLLLLRGAKLDVTVHVHHLNTDGDPLFPVCCRDCRSYRSFQMLFSLGLDLSQISTALNDTMTYDNLIGAQTLLDQYPGMPVSSPLDTRAMSAIVQRGGNTGLDWIKLLLSRARSQDEIDSLWFLAV